MAVLHATGSASAVKVATVAAAPGAAEPRCAHFGPCGGCSLQGLEYSAQLAAKQVRKPCVASAEIAASPRWPASGWSTLCASCS